MHGHSELIRIYRMHVCIGISERVTDISKDLKKDVDMTISIPKTIALHVRQQDEVSKTTPEEAKKLCRTPRFKCPHLNCNKP